MTKILDLEEDVVQFKEATSDRLDKLELAVDALTTETRQISAEARQTATDACQAAATADQRHVELLAILHTLQHPSATSSPATTLPPPTPLPLTTLPLTTLPPPHSTPAVSQPVFRPPPPPHSRTTPLSVPFTQSIPSFGPSATMPITQPLILTSNLVFDEFGSPIPTTCPPLTYLEVNSSFSNSYYTPHRTESSGSRYVYSTYESHRTPPHGPRVLENKVWVPGADYRLCKLKMPIFEGEDVYGWIYRVERFFDIQGLITSVERLRAAVLCMEGQPCRGTVGATTVYRSVRGNI